MRTWKGESCGGGPLHRNWNLMLGYLAYLGFPGDSDAKEWGRPGFDPSVGKMPWRRAWQSTPVFLPGESHEQMSLVDYSPCGRKELDMAERLSTVPSLSEDTGREGSWGVNTPSCLPSLWHSAPLAKPNWKLEIQGPIDAVRMDQLPEWVVMRGEEAWRQMEDTHLATFPQPVFFPHYLYHLYLSTSNWCFYLHSITQMFF